MDDVVCFAYSIECDDPLDTERLTLGVRLCASVLNPCFKEDFGRFLGVSHRRVSVGGFVRKMEIGKMGSGLVFEKMGNKKNQS